MAAALLEESRSWSSVRLLHVNARYAEARTKLTRFGFAKVLKALSHLIATVRLVRREEATLVVLTVAFHRGPFLKDAFFILALRLLCSARLVAWVHMDPARLDYEGSPFWYAWLVRTAVAKVDRWVACADRLLQTWPAFLPASARYAIPNGIDAPALPIRAAPAAGLLRVVYLSAMDREKGWDDLLFVAERICARAADVEFCFHGAAASSDSDADIALTFSRVSFLERIRWLGPVAGDAKWQSLAAADIFCFPSRTEQFPVAVLEAMAAGLPVVATRVGAVEDAIIPGKGGWLVVPGSRVRLEQALLMALEDRERLRSFGAFNRKRFESEFTRARFGARWQQFLLEAGRASPSLSRAA